MNAAVELKRRPKFKGGKTTLHSQAQKAVKMLIITLTSMIAVLAIVFLLSTNENAQKGYSLQLEKIKNEHLKSENNNISAKITQAKTFNKIKENEKVENMEEIPEKNYVTKEDNSVY